MNDIIVRPMTEADLPGACELRRLAGWNQTPEDWRRMLSLEPDGCFVALQDGEVVGTVTATTYGQALAWIGMMLVHPERRRQGIGRRLMLQALEYLRGCGVPTIKLDATPAGYPLYEQLGFVSEWTLTRWNRPAEGQTPFPESVLADTRALNDADWRAVDALDAAAFGTPRARLVRSFVPHNRAALVWPAQGPVAGWGLLRPGANADYLGPLVCSGSEGLLALATALLRTAENRSVFWDVPDQNEAAKAMAQRFGFETVRPLTRMRLGPDSITSNPQAMFAIVDPAVG